MRTVVFTGAAGPAAAAIIEAVTAAADDRRAVVVAPRPFDVAGATVRVADLVGTDLDDVVKGAAAVVHLGTAVDESDPYLLAPGRAVREAVAVLAAAARVGVDAVQVVSSTAVLGALANNPVPLTEDAVIHPEPQFRPAVELAEIERLVGEQGGPVTVLRAAPVVADGAPGWFATELHRSLAYPVEGHDPGLQYLHADDLGAAISRVLDEGSGGVLHVAPDGSLDGAQRRALESRPWMRVPAGTARFAASARAALRGTSGPEGIRPYLLHPWLVANDRLRTLGWEPVRTNEDAYVAAFRAAPWSMLGSGRRQELLLGGAGALVVGGLAGFGWLVRRRRG